MVETGFDKDYGARPLRRIIQRKIENQLSKEILLHNYKKGDDIQVDIENDNGVTETHDFMNIIDIDFDCCNSTDYRWISWLRNLRDK